nr:Phenazine biosynthesis-like protein [uncultured bacterium]
MNLQIFQVDAFTKEVFRGNPAAVVPLPKWLDDETMQRIAAENNLAETAFFVPMEDHYEIRWFTPAVEVNLCGHATLGSAYVIFNCLHLEDHFIRFSSKSGELTVEKQGDVLVLDFPRYGVNEIEIDKKLVEAVDKKPLQMFETQGHMVMMLFEKESDVAAIAPDFSALTRIEDFNEVIVTAKGGASDFVSRMFAPKLGIPEDPVTGAIHCSLIPFWAERLGKEQLFARQISARGGDLFCSLSGDRVKIGGNASLYLKGEIYV